MFLSGTADWSLELSAGGGRPSLHNRPFMSHARRTRHFALRTRFALHAKYRVRLAWFITRLLCRPRKSLLITRLMPTYDHAPCFSFVYRSLYAVLKCCCCLRAPGIDTYISLLVILGVSVTWKNNQLILAVHQAWLCSMSGVKGYGLPFGHGHNGGVPRVPINPPPPPCEGKC